MNQPPRPSKTGITGSPKATASDLRTSAENTRIIHMDRTTGAIPRQVFRNGTLVNHRTWKQQVVGGMWVHWVQKNTDPDVWGELFTGNKRCLLKREEIEQTN